MHGARDGPRLGLAGFAMAGGSKPGGRFWWQGCGKDFPMKIAMIGTRGIPPNYGGTETYVEQLTLQLAKHGDEILVYGGALGNDQALLEKAASYPPNIRRIEIPSFAGKHSDNFIRSLLATLHVCFQREVEIVQFNNIGPAVFAFLPRLFGKKVVGAIRAMDSKREKWGFLARNLLRLCERLVVAFPHETTTNSKAIVDYYRENYGAEIHYTPNGAIIPTAPSAPCVIRKWGLDHKSYILFVARLVPEKGCHTLVEAFERLDCPGMKLVVAGAGAYRDSYVDELQAHASDRILFVGHVTGPALDELYDNAFAFVLPSAIEGMSNSLLSAMAHGCPVVVSDIAENVAVVAEAPTHTRLGVNPALVFKLGDASDLAAKLAILVNDPEEAARRGAALRAYAEASYSWESSSLQTREIYQRLLD